MSTWTILILAVGLAADAFAVSIGKGLLVREDVSRVALLLGGTFGLAQGIMPVFGWLLGSTFADRVHRFAPWIAFVLLAVVGVKMLHEAISRTDDVDVQRGGGGPDHWRNLTEILILAIATSIDAMAVGVSLAVLDVSIWFVSAVIALVTFALCSAAVFIGYTVGSRYRRPAEIVGGLALVGIGVHVLVG